MGRRSDDPYAAELDYFLNRLSNELSGFTFPGFRIGLYSHRDRAELLAQMGTLLRRADEVGELAERVREVLLRPPPDDKNPGFTE